MERGWHSVPIAVKRYVVRRLSGVTDLQAWSDVATHTRPETITESSTGVVDLVNETEKLRFVLSRPFDKRNRKDGARKLCPVPEAGKNGKSRPATGQLLPQGE